MCLAKVSKVEIRSRNKKWQPFLGFRCPRMGESWYHVYWNIAIAYPCTLLAWSVRIHRALHFRFLPACHVPNTTRNKNLGRSPGLQRRQGLKEQILIELLGKHLPAIGSQCQQQMIRTGDWQELLQCRRNISDEFMHTCIRSPRNWGWVSERWLKKRSKLFQRLDLRCLFLEVGITFLYRISFYEQDISSYPVISGLSAHHLPAFLPQIHENPFLFTPTTDCAWMRLMLESWKSCSKSCKQNTTSKSYLQSKYHRRSPSCAQAAAHFFDSMKTRNEEPK